MHSKHQVEGVVAVHGTPSGPLSAERVEVRTALFRIRQAQNRLDHLAKHAPSRTDPEHAQMRSDLEAAENVLVRWEQR